jgi:acetoin utilization protein AcuB
VHDTPIREVMTKSVITIEPGLKVDVALETMRANGIRRLPVVGRTGRLAGILTIDEATRAMPEGVTFAGAGDTLTGGIPDIRDVMTRDVKTLGPDALVAQAAQLMVEHKIGAVPVVEDHVVVGIVTESDLFRHIARYFGEITPSTGDMP